MPEPPGGRGQKSIFAFPGFKKYVEVRGVLHEVVPPALDDFDAKHPLLCRWGCGERFSRGTAKANHEKHCKKKSLRLLRCPTMSRSLTLWNVTEPGSDRGRQPRSRLPLMDEEPSGSSKKLCHR